MTSDSESDEDDDLLPDDFTHALASTTGWEDLEKSNLPCTTYTNTLLPNASEKNRLQQQNLLKKGIKFSMLGRFKLAINSSTSTLYSVVRAAVVPSQKLKDPSRASVAIN